MKIIKASAVIETPIDGMTMLKNIERVARTCYKSEDKISSDGSSALKMIEMLIQRGHEAMIEHESFTVRFIVDRGVSHELVRHRIASYAQESTRYCNYGKNGEVVYIDNTALTPYSLSGIKTKKYQLWERLCLNAEQTYLELLHLGCTPQEARSVLPTSLKTEVVMTANLREWRQFLKLRTATSAHPQMREVTTPLLKELKKRIPVVFDGIAVV